MPTFELATGVPTPSQERLIDACEILIARRGPAGVTVADIRRQAGHANHAAVGYHFGSLEGLVRATYDWRSRPLHAARRHRLAELDAAGRGDDLEALVRVVVETLRDRLAELRPSSLARFHAALFAVRPYVLLERMGTDPAETVAVIPPPDDDPHDPMQATIDLQRRVARAAAASGSPDGATATASAVRASGALFAAWEADVEMSGDDGVPLDVVAEHAAAAALAIVTRRA